MPGWVCFVPLRPAPVVLLQELAERVLPPGAGGLRAALASVGGRGLDDLEPITTATVPATKGYPTVPALAGHVIRGLPEAALTPVAGESRLLLQCDASGCHRCTSMGWLVAGAGRLAWCSGLAGHRGGTHSAIRFG